MNANSYSSPGTSGGNREWLDGKLTILEPEETPFVSMVTKINNAKGTLHECVADTLRPARTAGSREGSSGTKGGNRSTKRARFGAYLHRWFDSFGVTDVQQAVSSKGGVATTTDEYGDSKAKCIREVKRDLEATSLSDLETQGGDDEMQTRGAFKWCASSQTPAIPAAYQTPSAQRLTGVTELKEVGSGGGINPVLKSLKTKGASGPYHFFCGNDFVEDIDLFTRTGDAGSTANRYRIQENGREQTVTMMVKVFATSFGRVEVHPDQFVRIGSDGVGSATSGLLASMDTWELNFLESLHSEDDMEDASGQTGWVKAIGGLFCRMPKANATVINS